MALQLNDSLFQEVFVAAGSKQIHYHPQRSGEGGGLNLDWRAEAPSCHSALQLHVLFTARNTDSEQTRSEQKHRTG